MIKPIDERMKANYVRVEQKNMDKPQSSIKFKISQKWPDYLKALATLKDKFITPMNNLFKTRPNYRICLGFNADYALPKEDLETRIGTKKPDKQIDPKYIKIGDKQMVKEEIYDEHVKEWVVQNIEVVNITLKTKAQFIYHEKEIVEILGNLYDDLTNKFDKLKR